MTNFQPVLSNMAEICFVGFLPSYGPYRYGPYVMYKKILFLIEMMSEEYQIANMEDEFDSYLHLNIFD